MRWFLLSGLAVVLLIAGKTAFDVRPFNGSELTRFAAAERYQVLDRNGVPLSISYQSALNIDDNLPLYAMPPLLKDAFIASEDRRFYTHHGVDWRARCAALWQNLRAFHGVRGASTITEQTVRILHPRPRTLWSRWIEGFEAVSLERHANKEQILEFYLNQVPYAAQRRGVKQAARYYFNRELSTMDVKETLALAVLPRAPSAYDLYRHPERITPAVLRLADAMNLPNGDELRGEAFHLSRPALPVEASHFVGYVRELMPQQPQRLVTTLDASLQRQAETLLAQRLHMLKSKQVHNGALLVADHTTGEILAWAVAGEGGEAIDAVRTPRQPGSAMKPFLYALALDSGWSPATILEDAPLSESINAGLHRFTNYSHTFYGKVTLREALGNSLNIPAVHTIGFVGVERYLDTLHRLGMQSLTQSADYYNEGLALGDGEITLLELTQAYAALANRGMYRPLTAVLSQDAREAPARIYSDESASLTANILSDPWARQWEFGLGSVLNMPVQTAVKTGTSTDYRDAWAMGFNARYVVGVWMGNLDGTPTDGVTGSTGPAQVLHSVFAGMNLNQATTGLYLSPRLLRKDICITRGAGARCTPRTEYFLPGSEPQQALKTEPLHPALVSPADGLMLAYDPRLPSDKQAFEFVAQGIGSQDNVEWALNDQPAVATQGGRYLWPVARGKYRLTLKTLGNDGTMHPVDTVSFQVK